MGGMAYLSRGDPSAALTVAETALIDDGNSPQFHHLKAKAVFNNIKWSTRH